MIEHSLGKTENLPACLVIIFLFTGKLSHLRESRNTHEEIVEPHSIGLRTVARERSVFQPVLLVHDVIDADIDQRPDVSLRAGAFRLYHRGGHRAGIIESPWSYEIAKGHSRFPIGIIPGRLLDRGRSVGDKFKPLF